MTCSAILIPLLWSIATMAATRKLATGAAAPVRVQKKTEKLPATGKPKKLDVFMKRSCLEQLYELDSALDDEEGNRNKIRAICSSCGMNEKFMVALRKKLPAGLVNNTESRTLRRAVNKLCGVKGDRQRWTQAELKIAVLGVVNDGASFRGTMAEYGIGSDCLNKHRRALLDHRKVGGTDDSYFAQDLTAGPLKRSSRITRRWWLRSWISTDAPASARTISARRSISRTWVRRRIRRQR